MAESLELENISKRFGAVAAVEPLTLAVQAGALLALLGPSGCGKTTTLRIIAGFERPDSGLVKIGGRDVTPEPPNRRRLGMVFQNYSLFPHMTVAENIAFGLKMAKVPRSEIPPRVSEALSLVRLPGFEDRSPAQLSGGQQQRVALARSLITSPAVLLLDEPLGALDKNLRESMQFELRQLQKRLGITTVLVTHDQEEALTMSDSVAVMNHGRVLQVGPPQEVYARPKERFVSEFLGASNLFHATRVSQDLFVLGGGGEASLPVRATPQDGAVSSSSVLLAIRPEKVTICEAAGEEVDAHPAQVIGRVFRGIYHAYQLKLIGRDEVVIAYRQGVRSRAKCIRNMENVLLGGPPQWMAQIEANRAKPPIDILVNVPDLALVAGRSGLVEKVSAQRAPNLADVPRSFIDIVDGYGSVFTYGCWGLCYHDRVKNPPKSLAEFIDGTVKGKWRAALPSMLGFAETAHVLIWSFSDIMGGSIDNVDPAFATIQKMKANSVFWNGISDPLTLLESGEADISIYVDGRTWAAFDSGAKWIRFINPEERGVNLPSVVQKVANGADAAWDYFDCMLSPTAQSQVAERLNYGVSNQKVQYPPKVKERITKWEQTRWPPFEKLTGETRRQWVERWGKEVRS